MLDELESTIELLRVGVLPLKTGTASFAAASDTCSDLLVTVVVGDGRVLEHATVVVDASFHSIEVTARDAAGNVGETSAELRVLAVPDDTPPTVHGSLALFGAVPRLNNIAKENKVPDVDSEISTGDPRTLLRTILCPDQTTVLFNYFFHDC